MAPSSRAHVLPLLPFILLLCLCATILPIRANIPAIFSFGDSYLDVGTTRFNPRAGYHANFLPYGQDYRPASGRFSNGKLVIDYLYNYLGIRQSKPYLRPRKGTKHGVNFASAGAAVNPGLNAGKTIPLGQQLTQFAQYYAAHNLSKVFFHGLAVIDIGTEDYVTYFRVGQSRVISEKKFVAQIAQNITSFITEINRISGVRKFVVMGMRPLGCLPEVRFTNGVSANCKSNMNQMAADHDAAMIPLMGQLRKKIPFILYARPFGLVYDAFNKNAAATGLRNWQQPCCSVKTPNNQMIQCGKSAVIGGKKYYAGACAKPDSYAWWDYRNPTQALNAVVANAVITGAQDFIFPMNLEGLAKI